MAKSVLRRLMCDECHRWMPVDCLAELEAETYQEDYGVLYMGRYCPLCALLNADAMRKIPWVREVFYKSV